MAEPIIQFMIYLILAGVLITLAVIGLLVYRVCIDDDYELLEESSFVNNSVPRDFLNDEESLVQLQDQYDFTHLSPEEQGSYLRAREFAVLNPPHYHHTRGRSFTAEDEALIKDRGHMAYYFELDSQQRYIVNDRLELDFNNNSTPYSTATGCLNYALPVKYRFSLDTLYFETKVFEYVADANSHFSIGLVTKPYPSSFRLPGYAPFSIGYESTGNLKINKPFPTPLQQHQGEMSEYNALVLPPLIQSDIVGFGYVISTGTLFITRNGKKILDIMKGCFVDLYPAIGCFSTNAKFQVNIGQMGFVWIEANVRKYGFVSTSDSIKLNGERGLQILPEYIHHDNDKILAKGEELPPHYPEDELDFFGRSVVGSSSKKLKSQLDDPLNEKSDEDEKKPKSITNIITNEPDEIMNLRERIYEQNAQNVNEFTPLMANTPDFRYLGKKDEKNHGLNTLNTFPVLSSLFDRLEPQEADNLIDFDEHENIEDNQNNNAISPQSAVGLANSIESNNNVTTYPTDGALDNIPEGDNISTKTLPGSKATSVQELSDTDGSIKADDLLIDNTNPLTTSIDNTTQRSTTKGQNKKKKKTGKKKKGKKK